MNIFNRTTIALNKWLKEVSLKVEIKHFNYII